MILTIAEHGTDIHGARVWVILVEDEYGTFGMPVTRYDLHDIVTDVIDAGLISSELTARYF